MNNPYIDADGNKFWRNKKGQYHREDGPAVEYHNDTQNGTQVWCINDEYHRDNGPAIIDVYLGLTRKNWYYENIRIR